MMTAEIKNNLHDDDIIWVDQTVTNSLMMSDALNSCENCLMTLYRKYEQINLGIIRRRR
jgi:hypothetical protein